MFLKIFGSLKRVPGVNGKHSDLFRQIKIWSQKKKKNITMGLGKEFIFAQKKNGV